MSLKRTTIISPGDVALARQQFNAIVCGKNALVIAVLGDDALSAKAVGCADQRAGVVVAGFERKVVWIKDRNLLASEIKKLPAGNADISNENLTDVAAFSVSLNGTTMTVVHVDDVISNLQMEAAFVEAGTV